MDWYTKVIPLVVVGIAGVIVFLLALPLVALGRKIMQKPVVWAEVCVDAANYALTFSSVLLVAMFLVFCLDWLEHILMRLPFFLVMYPVSAVVLFLTSRQKHRPYTAGTSRQIWRETVVYLSMIIVWHVLSVTGNVNTGNAWIFAFWLPMGVLSILGWPLPFVRQHAKPLASV